jgi:hypothetical protein
MDGSHFDALSRAIADVHSRRGLSRLLGGIALGGHCCSQQRRRPTPRSVSVRKSGGMTRPPRESAHRRVVGVRCAPGGRVCGPTTTRRAGRTALAAVSMAAVIQSRPAAHGTHRAMSARSAAPTFATMMNRGIPSYARVWRRGRTVANVSTATAASRDCASGTAVRVRAHAAHLRAFAGMVLAPPMAAAVSASRTPPLSALGASLRRPVSAAATAPQRRTVSTSIRSTRMSSARSTMADSVPVRRMARARTRGSALYRAERPVCSFGDFLSQPSPVRTLCQASQVGRPLFAATQTMRHQPADMRLASAVRAS